MARSYNCRMGPGIEQVLSCIAMSDHDTKEED
jgi:hypothetical protein